MMRRAQAAPTGRLVVVIDDHPLALEGMSGLLRSWGYQVVAAATEEAALARLTENDQRPDLIICDYRLSEGESGLDVIERLREVFDVPALLITGDAALDRLHAARASRYPLLHKPIDAMALRAMIRQMLNDKGISGADE
jgi:two-component system, sensor histidine kinase